MIKFSFLYFLTHKERRISRSSTIHRTARHSTKAKNIIGLMFCFSLLGQAYPASAQSDGCTDESLDAFSFARQSRRIVSDYYKLQKIHRDDMIRNARLYKQQTGLEPDASAALAGVFEFKSTFGFESCSNQGRHEATLSPFSLGAIASIDLHQQEWALELFALMSQDRLEDSPSLSQTRTEDGGFKDPTGLANVSSSQSMLGGRLTFRDWVTVLGGYILSGDVINTPGENGRSFLLDSTATGISNRIYLGAGIPKYSLFTNIIFDQNDIAPDQFDLNVDDIELPMSQLIGQANIGYIEDENQAYLGLGLKNIFRHFSMKLSFEHRPVRLRSARLGTAWSRSAGWEAEDIKKLQSQLEAAPRFALDFGGFAEATYFGSRYLKERTGESGVWGANFGFFARSDLTLLMGRLDVFFGVNQPDELSRRSELANHWQVGWRIHGRFGL